MKKINKAFTLVELIVVITILAILGTIAFISLQGYSKSARDSKRISDINNIKLSLEFFILGAGYYPEPDEGKPVTFSGDTVRTQGFVGDIVTTNLSRNLTKKPIDPLFNIEYIYSVTNSKNEYEVMSIHENNFANNNLINNTYAADNYIPKVEGIYNEVFVKTPNFIVPTPSIINSEVTGTGLILDDDNIDSQVVTDGNNFPDLGILNTEQKIRKLDINLSVYEGIITKKSTDADKITAIESIQGAYSGTTLSSQSTYTNILNTSDLLVLADQLLFNNGVAGADSVAEVVTNNEGGTCVFGESIFGNCTFE